MNMNTTFLKRVVSTIAFGAAVTLTAAGCQHRDRVAGEDFRPDSELRAVQHFEQAQAAAGARADGTLRGYHFDCTDLNSLGQEKLGLMLKDDDSCSPIVVYLDVPADDSMDARQEAIAAYLKDHGVAANQFRVEKGANPNSFSPAALGLRGERKLEGNIQAGTLPEPTGSPTPGTGMAK
jgi:hypothetical protein